MKRAFLDDAEPAPVAQAVQDLLHARGALVSEHTSSRVRFRLLPARGSHVWTREGYVGVYQALGEKEVEVRLALRAQWPARILWAVAAVNVVLAVLTFLFNPPGTTWFVVAFLCGLALLVAALLHLNTLRGVRAEERALMDGLMEELRRDLPGAALATDEEHAWREAEDQLQGEVVRRRLATARRDEPKPPKPPKEKGKRFSLGLKRDPPSP